VLVLLSRRPVKKMILVAEKPPLVLERCPQPTARACRPTPHVTCAAAGVVMATRGGTLTPTSQCASRRQRVVERTNRLTKAAALWRVNRAQVEAAQRRQVHSAC
jgi:hypothetical protein